MKKVIFKSEAQEKLLKGINTLNDAVSCTMGAYGQTVIYEYNGEKDGRPVSTKDGVTVANHIELDDPIENIGASIVKDAARKTARVAGDGTTTSTVLAAAILNEAVGREGSQRDYIRGMEAASKKVIEYLDKETKEVDDDMLAFVANISTNSDEVLGPVISNAFKDVGEYGHVWYEPNYNGVETTSKIESGTTIPSGLMDPKFINTPETRTSNLDNPLIFMSTSKIDSVRQLESILEYAVKEVKRPLLMIMDFAPEVGTTILSNKVNNGFRFNLIKPPHIGIIQREALEDLAYLVGATVHGVHLGDSAESITPDLLGEADFSQSDMNNTVIRIKEKKDMTSKIKELNTLIEAETSEDRKKTLRNRLANIAGSVAMISVGAASDAELKEKMDRVDDAIHAVMAAKQEGILPGGGIALKNASESIKAPSGDDDYAKGYKALLEAIKMPYLTILRNADLKEPTGLKCCWGVNVLTGKKVNMIEEGIIDPTLATKEAVINAVSVSKTILSTGATIYTV